MRQSTRTWWLLLSLCLFLSACQPIKSLPNASTLPPKAEVGVTPCRPTAGQRLGNEAIKQQPISARLDLAAATEPGERLVITGVVYAADCVTPLANAMIEVWQTDAAGVYGDLAGTLRTDADARYELHTVKPGYYAGEANPPPLHIHFRIDHLAAQGIETEIVFADDPVVTANPTLQPLAISLQRTTAKDGRWQGVFAIVLADK